MRLTSRQLLVERAVTLGWWLLQTLVNTSYLLIWAAFNVGVDWALNELDFKTTPISNAAITVFQVFSAGAFLYPVWLAFAEDYLLMRRQSDERVARMMREGPNGR